MLLDEVTEVDSDVFLQLDGHTTVNDQRLPRNERGLIRAEKGDGIGNVIRHAGAAEWVLLFEETQPVGMRLPLSADPLGHNVARADRVDPDTIRPERRAKLAGHPPDGP